MCGIVGYSGKNRAVPYLLDGLSRLEYRGYDSAGIALYEEGIEITKCKGRLTALKKKLEKKKQSEASCGIGHTRWATHGIPDEKNAHPHLSKSGLFAVVHNGIIENYEEIKACLMSEGYNFKSETDTEVIAHLLEKNYGGSFTFAVKKTLAELEGSFALAIICRDYPKSIFCARRGSPLVAAKGEKGCLISSDANTLLRYTDEVYRLENNESLLAEGEKLSFFDKDMKSIEKTPEKLHNRPCEVEKGKYEHFMLKEIYEQGETAEKTVRECINKNEIVFEGSEPLFDKIKQVHRIAFIGCGSAYHVCLSAKHITEELCGIYASAEIASEWRYGFSPLSENCLAVFISQSGETADTLAALRKAKKLGAVTLSIVNSPLSSLEAESDFVIHTKAGPEIAVATTKAYTAQLMTVYLLSVKIARLRNSLTDEKYKSLLEEIKSFPRGIKTLLEKIPSEVKALSEKLFSEKRMYFLGRGTDFAAAIEGALKLKEISYIPCEAYAAGELKHGTISLIEKGSIVIALASDRRLFAKTSANLKEVKARGAEVVVFCSSGEKTDEDFTTVRLPFVSGCFSALYEGIALQLLSYFVAKRLGCDIDKPRNLAKSVTVE